MMETKYVTSEEMYQIDRYTIEEIGLPSPVLMERAAHAAFLDLKTKITKEETVLVAAGTGNNGGDAVALARMLFIEGYHVRCLITGPDKHSEGMALQVRIAEKLDLPISYGFSPLLVEKAD